MQTATIRWGLRQFEYQHEFECDHAWRGTSLAMQRDNARLVNAFFLTQSFDNVRMIVGRGLGSKGWELQRGTKALSSTDEVLHIRNVKIKDFNLNKQAGGN